MSECTGAVMDPDRMAFGLMTYQRLFNEKPLLLQSEENKIKNNTRKHRIGLLGLQVFSIVLCVLANQSYTC